MLEKIMAKRNVNHLSHIPKTNLVNSKNIHILTRQGTKIGEDRIITNDATLPNQHYSNVKMQKKVYNDATNVFKKLANDEDKVERQNNKSNELLQILCNEDTSRRLINILNMLK